MGPCRCNQLKTRSHQSRVAPIHYDWRLIKRGNLGTRTQGECHQSFSLMMMHEGGNGVMSRNPGPSRVASKPPEARGLAQNRPSRGVHLADTRIPYFRPPECEAIHSVVLSHPVCGAALGNFTGSHSNCAPQRRYHLVITRG